MATKQPTVRVTEATHQALIELTAGGEESMAEVPERAVERERRERLLADANAAWVALIADPATRAELRAEQEEWDGTLADGLTGERR